MGVRASLRRYHVWLGWLVALPFLFWTVSGLVMVAKPIEEVRGTALIADPEPIALTAGLVVPRIEGRAVSSLKLVKRAGGPRWVVDFADGDSRLADPGGRFALHRQGERRRNQPGRSRQPAAGASPGDGRLAGPHGR